MNQDLRKQKAVQKAIESIMPNTVVGVGAGAIIELFVQELIAIQYDIDGVVCACPDIQAQLQAAGVNTYELNYTGDIALYVDEADEATDLKHLNKNSLTMTREKIIAEAADKFICFVEKESLVNVLGKKVLSIEVIPMARSLVARKLAKIGFVPMWREGETTLNGNEILDIPNAHIAEPRQLEIDINNIPGVVGVGLFVQRKADILIVADDMTTVY